MTYQNFILHDIDDQKIIKKEDNFYFNALVKYAYCKGCFDCWLKTPGECIMKDKVYKLADVLADVDTFIIVSKCLYGGFSKETKGVVDRLIAFNLPFFRKLNNELHHKTRYKKDLNLEVYFYGDLTDEEKQTATNYAKAISLNFSAKSLNIHFVKDPKEIEVIK